MQKFECFSGHYKKLFITQVIDDGKLPRQICLTCNQAVKDISTFFDVLTAGQRRLRELWKEQVHKWNCSSLNNPHFTTSG